MLATGTVIKNKYQVTGTIGHGGMSVVYSATYLANGAKLAIKEAVRNGYSDNKLMERGLTTEGNLLKSLNNPHLPRIYDIIEDSSNIMIVMDYVEGASLDKVIEQNGPMPVEQVLDIGIQVCDVLYYLHTQMPPIIYRDMKPANLIMRSDGFIMMTDFGTARTWKVDYTKTSDTILIGTQGFAAPEQYGGYGQSDARTDIFCLGATLYNMVTGHSPYKKPMGIQPLGSFNPDLKDTPIDKIIQKCTANDPNERFQTDHELQEALKAALNGGGKNGFFTGFLKPKKEAQKKKGFQAVELKAADGRSQQFAQNNVGKNQDFTRNHAVDTAEMHRTGSDARENKGTTGGYVPSRNPYEAASKSQPIPYKNYEPSENPYSSTNHRNINVNRPGNGGSQQRIAAREIGGKPDDIANSSQLQETNGEIDMQQKWKTLAVISLIVGAVLLIIGIAAALLGVTIATVILVVAAIGAVALGAISTVFYLRC